MHLGTGRANSPICGLRCVRKPLLVSRSSYSPRSTVNVCVAGQSEHRGHLDAATVQVPIFWTDMLDQGVRLPRDYPGLVQSWKCWGSVGPGREQIGKAWGSAGAPAVQSTCWYLDWDSPAEELLRHPLRGTSEVREGCALLSGVLFRVCVPIRGVFHDALLYHGCF